MADIIIEVVPAPTINVSIETYSGFPGPGIAIGGTAGQLLRKKTSTNYDTEWGLTITSGTTTPSGGSDGDIYVQYT